MLDPENSNGLTFLSVSASKTGGEKISIRDIKRSFEN